MMVEVQAKGKVVDKHCVVWGKTPTQEIYHFQHDAGDQVGQFSGLKFKTGNKSFYNGPDGFIALQHFDGQLIDGVVPPDSPCSARIASRQKSIQIESPYELLLFELFTERGGVGGPLDAFASKASEYLELTKQNCRITSGKTVFEIEFAPSPNDLVSSVRKTTDGKVTEKSAVVAFKPVDHFGLFPEKIKSTLIGPNGAELDIVCTVQECRINEQVDNEFLTLLLPEEVPLFNATSGKFGYWKDGSAHYFASEHEAQKWQKDRSVRHMSQFGRSSSSTSWSTLWGGSILFALFLFVSTWFRRGR